MIRTATALAAAVLTLAQAPALAAPTADWHTPAAACHAADAHSSDFATVDEVQGLVRSGRNPPLKFICPLHKPGGTDASPDWTVLEMLYLDPNAGGGRITAKLRSKNRVTGTAATVATVTSVQGESIQSRSVRLRRGLDFSTYHYWISFEMNASPGDAAVETHALELR